MCVWDPIYGVDGPHPYGQWGVYMPNEYVLETLSWMSANHGEFEVLFHPNTGYMVGGKLTLRMYTSTVTYIS
jgi:aromatic ring-cleaving dioxygenase